MAFRSAGTATSVALATTSAAAAAPAGFVAGDILILVLSSDANTSTATPPSGFTQLTKDTFSTPDGQVAFIWWKRAVGSDSLTVTGMANTDSKLLRCFAWSGRDTINPPVISASAINQSSNASPTTLTANGVTALASDDLFWVGVLDVNAASATNTFTQPTGYTTQGSSVDTVNQFDVFAAATKDNVSAGATGTVAGTLTHSGSAGWDAFIVRIPVAGGLTTDQLSPNWYTDGETATSARSQYTAGTVQFHHEIFVADGFDPGLPILPISATSGIWYNEHLDFPNIQGPQHKMQDVDLERWTQRIILPAQPSWDNDAESQNAQPGNQGIGSDQGLDWTQFIVIPGFDASVSRVDIDDFANQFPNPGWAAILAEYETWTQNVLIPTVAWDTDTDNQVQQDGYHVNDANLDWTEFVVLQVLPFDPSTSFVDSDVDYQGPQAGYFGLGSDSGQDWVQYILIPAPAWDGDLDHPPANPTAANANKFDNDEMVGVPIVFITATGQTFTLYVPLHQLSPLHGLTQI